MKKATQGRPGRRRPAGRSPSPPLSPSVKAKARRVPPNAASHLRVETPEDPLRIVALGGGTGLAALLKGLKHFSMGGAGQVISAGPLLDLTAVVTVSDDGGSSGRLRKDFDILAPGDIRNCMVALAEDEALLGHLFQYRFSNGRGLQGHNFGNLFLAALTHVTGDFHQAIQLSSEVLAIRGRIYPSTLTNVRLSARMRGGRVVKGESRISGSHSVIEEIWLDPPDCQPLKETLAAIAAADLITLGPGSLYTSVIPNLLVRGITPAIAKSPALKVYVSNLMWQPGETIGYTAADHLRTVHQHAGMPLVEYVIANSRKAPPAVRRRYERQQANQVEIDTAALKKMGVELISANLLAKGDIVRHDSARLAQLLAGLARQGRLRKISASVKQGAGIKT